MLGSRCAVQTGASLTAAAAERPPPPPPPAPMPALHELRSRRGGSRDMPACGEVIADATEAPPVDLMAAEPEVEVPEEALSPVQRFFRARTVLLTGATGFMGKVLLQKLLRACPDVRLVHLLIRTKRGKDPEARLDEIFEDPLFQAMKDQVPKWRHKVNAVSGDCALPGLGLSDSDRALLQRDVEVLFHGAATVRFDEKLKLAVAINVSGTREILRLAKEMPNLKAITHISTAFCHCPLPEINESFYETPLSYEKVLEITSQMDDNALEAITPKILGKYPNTYALTKALAEGVVKAESRGLPMVIFRPAIVMGTRNDPVAGWIDNVYGPTGVVVGAGLGLMHTLYCNSDAIANIVPVDMSVNALIAATWDVACNPNVNNNNNNNNNNKCVKDTTNTTIYNYVSSCDQPLKWGEFMEKTERHGLDVPTVRSVWYYSFRLTNSRLIYLIQVLLMHFLPALLVDAVIVVMRGKPKIVKVYKKMYKLSEVIAYFCTRTWTFSNKNVVTLWDRLSEEDRKLFDFDMNKLDWEEFFKDYIMGCRLYLLKDEYSTLPQARVRWRRFYWAHQTLKVVLGLLAFNLMWPVVSYASSFIFT